jgi:L-ascorbate metabolism protein UlaG (beta-lactamase superfamily)
VSRERRASAGEALKHLADLGSFALRRGSHHRHDALTLEELEARPVELPSGLSITWLGVAGFLLTFEGHTLVLDPYVSRISFGDFVRRRPTLPDRTRVDGAMTGAGEVVGVLAGHTHFDHVLDVPAVARQFGCRAYGSRSLVRLMSVHGQEAQADEVRPGDRIELGPFAVTFVPSRHSKIVLGLRVPMDGDIAASDATALHARAYRCGQVWAFLIEVAGERIYHQGSADLVDDAVPEGGVDMFLAGVAGREFTPNYWRRILPRLEPQQVVVCHHDDFFRGLDEPLAFAPNVRLEAVPDEIGAVSREPRVLALPRFEQA